MTTTAAAEEVKENTAVPTHTGIGDPAITALADQHCLGSNRSTGVADTDGRWTFDANGLQALVAAARASCARSALAAPLPVKPPLLGRWHHGQGYLVSGSIRISRWDCDTNPPTQFRDTLLDWVCATLNAAGDAWKRVAPDDLED